MRDADPLRPRVWRGCYNESCLMRGGKPAERNVAMNDRMELLVAAGEAAGVATRALLTLAGCVDELRLDESAPVAGEVYAKNLRWVEAFNDGVLSPLRARLEADAYDIDAGESDDA